MATIYWYLFRLDSRKEKMRAFMGDLNNFTPNLKFAYDSGKEDLFLGPLRHPVQRWINWSPHKTHRAINTCIIYLIQNIHKRIIVYRQIVI